MDSGSGVADTLISKASSALKANSTRHAVPNAVPATFEAYAGEQCRVPTFIWRSPRIAAYYANLRDCALPSESEVECGQPCSLRPTDGGQWLLPHSRLGRL